MTTLAVVGPTGTVGRSVCRASADRGWTVIRCTRDGVATAWSELASQPLDAVVNCVGVGMSSGEDHRGIDLLDANLLVPIAAASLALRTDARLVHIGSAAQKSEHLATASPYVRSKTLASEALRFLAETDGLSGVELMPHIIYGGDGSEGIAGAMVRSIVDGTPFGLRTPRVRRDFVHRDDVGRAVIAAVESDTQSWFSVEVGTGEGSTMSEVATMIGDLVGVAVAWRLEPSAGRTWVEDLVADPSPARASLGFSTEISLEEGLARMVRERMGVRNP